MLSVAMRMLLVKGQIILLEAVFNYTLALGMPIYSIYTHNSHYFCTFRDFNDYHCSVVVREVLSFAVQMLNMFVVWPILNCKSIFTEEKYMSTFIDIFFTPPNMRKRVTMATGPAFQRCFIQWASFFLFIHRSASHFIIMQLTESS